MVALSTTACISADPVPTSRWSPPPKEVVDVEDDSVVVGRLWVMPNPIRVRPEWGGTIGSGDQIVLDVMSLGACRTNQPAF
jgi:hypothetical protein